jgi:gliding motility-associated-like protein
MKNMKTILLLFLVMMVVGQDQRVDVCIEESKKEYTYSVQSDTPNTTFYWYVDGVYHFGQTLTINWETYSPGVHEIVVYGKTEGCLSDPLRYNVYVGECSSIYVPNAFTPNGDGKNDAFCPLSICTFQHYEFLIFNRWGQLIFKTTNQFNKWNGKFKDADCPSGVYIYLITYKFPSQPKKSIRSSITLLR